jgi:protein SCO1
MDRPRYTLSRAIVTAAVTGVTLVLVAACGDGSDSEIQRLANSGQYRGSEPPAGITLGDFSLRNYDGRHVDANDLHGQVIVLTFLDSQCTESCPVIAWTVARTVDSLTPAERRMVQAVAISTDPAEDSPARVRRFLARNRALGRLLYLGGGQSEQALRAVWEKEHVLSSLESGHDTVHSAPVRIYDRRGNWAATLHAGADLTQAGLAHDIRVALSTTD